MKWLYALAAALLLATPAHAQVAGSSSLAGGTVNPQYPDFSLCAPYAPNFNHIWYIDPVNGHTQSGGGTGSQANPWDSLSAVVSSVAGYSGPLLSTAAGGQNIINPGDEILLMSGNYGDFPIDSITNSDYVTIAAAPGQTPVIGQFGIIISGGAHVVTSITKFAFVGLKIQKSTAGSRLVDIRGTAGSPTRDIIFDHVTVNSVDGTAPWTTPAQWVANASQGITWAQGGEPNGLNTVACGTISNSHIYNIFNALYTGGDELKTINTEIDHFTGDALDYDGNNQLILKNHLHDRIDDSSGIHGDFMQGFIGRNVHDVRIDSNVVNYQEDPILPFYLNAGTNVTIATVRAPQTGITPTCATTGNTQILQISVTVPNNPTPLVVGNAFEIDAAQTGGNPSNLMTQLVVGISTITGTGPFVITGLHADTNHGPVLTCPTSVSPGNFYDGNTTISSPTRNIGFGISVIQSGITSTIFGTNYTTGEYNLLPATTPGAATAAGNAVSFTGCIGDTDSDWTRLVVVNNSSACNQGGSNGMAFDSLHDSLIANNTLIGCMRLSNGSLVGANTPIFRNNLVTCYSMVDPDINGDHNIAPYTSNCCYIASLGGFQNPAGTYANNTWISATAGSLFVNYDPANLIYDLRLSPTSAAIGLGSSATPLAPFDIVGAQRVAPFSPGAYVP